MRRVDIEGALVDPSDLGAHLLQDAADQRDVADVWDIFNGARLVAEDDRRDDRDGSVLGSADIDLSK